ncbi:phosphonate ABC transporter ATP-binding protein [Brevibacterium album]|uniref:phosphonate ABC transporter ATP-binding protein n=1 Tax=Brevibacterium album TaxID=417948 RepID=UPI00041172AB|nr:ATP-binding cassette domain-containing protein [Brevibacterium album]
MGAAPTLSLQTATAPALSVADLRISFSGRTVLDSVSFDVHAGELVAFLGANGSGKSTTLRAVAGLLGHDSGTIEVEGRPTGWRPQRSRPPRQDARTAMVFQRFHLVPRRSVLANVCTGALHRMTTWQSLLPLTFPTAVKEEAMEALARVGLTDRAHEPAGRLSGGQQQRVAIARALCQGARVLLADEPTSALDPSAAATVMELLRDLAEVDGLAVAAVLHSPSLAREYAHRIIGLRDGRIVMSGTPETVAEGRIAGLYGTPTPQEAAA